MIEPLLESRRRLLDTTGDDLHRLGVQVAGEELGQDGCRVRRDLAGLENHCVAGSQSADHCHQRQVDRVVVTSRCVV